MLDVEDILKGKSPLESKRGRHVVKRPNDVAISCARHCARLRTNAIARQLHGLVRRLGSFEPASPTWPGWQRFPRLEQPTERSGRQGRCTDAGQRKGANIRPQHPL